MGAGNCDPCSYILEDAVEIKTTHYGLNKAGLTAFQTVRPVEFATETRDCFVHAMAAVLGLPYKDAHAFVAGRFGRKPRKGTFKVEETCATIAEAQEIIFGFRFFKHNAATGRRPVYRRFQYSEVLTYATLEQFARTHKTGKWLLWSNSHAFAVVNGVILDNGAARPRTQVTGVFEVIESSKVEGKSPFAEVK